MAKILVHTLGSSGDLNPFLALGLELQARGHAVHFAVAPAHARKARALGFAATDAGPDADLESDLMRRLLDADRFSPIRVLFNEVLIPAIGPATEALEPLARDADLFLCHTVQLAGPAVAHRSGTPWVSAITAPATYPTAEYPPPGVAWKGCPAVLSRLGWGLGFRLFAEFDRRAAVEYARLGVPPVPRVLSGGTFSRRLTLGLWSPSYAPRPTDWPDWLQVGGYARWDAPPETLIASVLNGEETGARGAPLVLFTLGSSVVNDPRGFYETALEAIAPTGWQALLLGAPADLPVPSALRERVTIVRYAPYAEVFPRADVVVHQGGVGTTQAACYYGAPAVIVPRGFDQFENAAHVQRNLWGLRLLPQDLSPGLLRRRVERALGDGEIRGRVAALGRRMRAEAGAAHSADLLEAVLTATP